MSRPDYLKLVPFLFVLLWSTGFIGAKYAMPYAEPATLLALRMALAAVLLLALISLFKASWPSPSGAIHAMVAGVLIHAVYLGGVFSAIRNGMPAGTAAIIVSLQPLVTAVLARLWLQETVSPKQITGLILGFIGVCMVVVFRMPEQASMAADTGNILFAVAALFGISVGTLYQKRFGQNTGLLSGAFFQYTGTVIVLALWSLTFETGKIYWNLQLGLALAWLVLVLSIAAILLLMLMIRHGQATTVASYFYLTPPVTAILAWYLFDEQLTPLALVGIALATLGVYLARAKRT